MPHAQSNAQPEQREVHNESQNTALDSTPPPHASDVLLGQTGTPSSYAMSTNVPNGLTWPWIASPPPSSYFLIQPFVRDRARIATILYDHKIRACASSSSHQFITDLVSCFPDANSVATDLSRHVADNAPNNHSPLVSATSIHLRRINVTSLAHFCALSATLVTSSYIWLLLVLALLSSMASFSGNEHFLQFITKHLPNSISQQHDYMIYKFFLDSFMSDDPFVTLQTPILIFDFLVNPAVFLVAIALEPFFMGALFYLLGAILGAIVNIALSLSGGLRIENHNH